MTEQQVKDDKTLDIDFAEMLADDEDALVEMQKALEEFLAMTPDSGGAVVDYITSTISYKQKVAKAETVEELEHAFVDSIVYPIASAAEKMETFQQSNAALSTLMVMSPSEMMSELANYVFAGIADEELAMKVSLARMDDYFTALCRQGCGYEVADTYLADVACYRDQKKRDALPVITPVKGFLKRFRARKGCIKEQIKMGSSAIKQIHSLRDVEIWYSRYALTAPIKYAREGFVAPLMEIATAPDDYIRKECAFLAEQAGYECSPEDFDVARVRHAMRTFCVNKTGYSHPENWLMASLEHLHHEPKLAQ